MFALPEKPWEQGAFWLEWETSMPTFTAHPISTILPCRPFAPTKYDAAVSVGAHLLLAFAGHITVLFLFVCCLLEIGCWGCEIEEKVKGCRGWSLSAAGWDRGCSSLCHLHRRRKGTHKQYLPHENTLYCFFHSSLTTSTTFHSLSCIHSTLCLIYCISIMRFNAR